MSRAQPRRLAPLAALFLALGSLPGCNVNKYCLDCELSGDAQSADANHADAAAIFDAAPDRDGCTPAGEEQCNGVDDDCDGLIDESPVAQVGNECGTDVGPCETGTLECVAGELICGGDVVAPVAETCNGEDDDCDGTPDDGDPGGGFVCGDAIGECERGITACVGGEIICDGEVEPTDELCDALDNNCNGTYDEGNPEGGAACGLIMGTCMPGTETCLGGTLVCVGGTTPNAESCDGADNDCDCPGDTNLDGTICGPGDTNVDEDFDFMNDPNRCGDCTTVCTVANGQPGCSLGFCDILFCYTGFWDNNDDVSDGCEYECDYAGAELCNGIDDDCDCPGDTNLDGIVCGPGDTNVDEGLIAPDMCNQITICSGTVALCEGSDGWVCDYPAAVTVDASGDIVPESDCDGVDNDCDGVVDDFFPTLGDACQRGTGVCQTSGNIVCNASDDGVECDAADGAGNATDEVCDGADQDCDGVPDNGAPDAWVQVSGSLWIYQYEASRPNATAASQGDMAHRPCSGANRLPWTNITQPQAEAQCALIGATLCSEAQWQTSCEASVGNCDWSYASACTSYNANTCNGNDYDFDLGTAGDQDGLLATGALTSCYANWGGSDRIYDLSGNVKEWTVQRSAGVNPLRGGSFNNTAYGISCEFDFVVADDTFQFQNVGFRCCRTSAP